MLYETYDKEAKTIAGHVLILILLEYALWVKEVIANAVKAGVLILILLEYALWGFLFAGIANFIWS